MILFLQVVNLSNIILHEHRATNIFHYIRSSVAFLFVGVSAVGTHLKYVSMRHSFTEITQKLELELRRAAFRSRRDCRRIDYVTDARGNKDLQVQEAGVVCGDDRRGGDVLAGSRRGRGRAAGARARPARAWGQRGAGRQRRAPGGAGRMPRRCGALAAAHCTALSTGHSPAGSGRGLVAVGRGMVVVLGLRYCHTRALSAGLRSGLRAAPLRPTGCDGRLHFTTPIQFRDNYYFVYKLRCGRVLNIFNILSKSYINKYYLLWN